MGALLNAPEGHQPYPSQAEPFVVLLWHMANADAECGEGRAEPKAGGFYCFFIWECSLVLFWELPGLFLPIPPSCPALLGAPSAAPPSHSSFMPCSVGSTKVLHPPPQTTRVSPKPLRLQVIPTPRVWWPSWPGCVVALGLHALQLALWDGSAALGCAEVPRAVLKAPMPSR